jgi:hypothetical protein
VARRFRCLPEKLDRALEAIPEKQGIGEFFFRRTACATPLAVLAR